MGIGKLFYHLIRLRYSEHDYMEWFCACNKIPIALSAIDGSCMYGNYWILVSFADNRVNICREAGNN